MAPVMGLKRPAAGAAAAQTVTLPAPAMRDAVRAAVREAEATAQATAPAARVPAAAAVPAEIARDGVLCLEEVDGRRWSYVVDAAGASVKAKGRASVGGAFKAVPLQSPLPSRLISNLLVLPLDEEEHTEKWICNLYLIFFPKYELLSARSTSSASSSTRTTTCCWSASTTSTSAAHLPATNTKNQIPSTSLREAFPLLCFVTCSDFFCSTVCFSFVVLSYESPKLIAYLLN